MQRGIGAILIIIILAIIAGVGAVIYGYFVLQNNSKPTVTIEKQTVVLPPENLIPPPEPQIGSSECPDTDYTGCDNSSLWMTWNGNVNENNASQSTIIEK